MKRGREKKKKTVTGLLKGSKGSGNWKRDQNRTEMTRPKLVPRGVQEFRSSQRGRKHQVYIF